MNTPIWDLLRSYACKDTLRLHMPGHKGKTLLGYESFDITEIDGADSLYEAKGIIKESENNASLLFGCDTFYSAEGSTLCIRAMLYLACIYAISQGKKPLILACRNAHRSFVNSMSSLEGDIEWIYPNDADSYLSCTVNTEKLEERFTVGERLPTAVYITSPDYLGKTADISSIAKICKKYGVLLLVDNAHGAYLKFLEPSAHPTDLGAHICCDSAHKTLPVITGGAYLHISKDADPFFRENAKQAMALFGSTSPSYLILASLDKANKYLSCGYKEKLRNFIRKSDSLKSKLKAKGYELYGNEALKISIKTKPFGYTGKELSDILAEKNIVCEFYDSDLLVMMLSPEFSDDELIKLENVLLSVKKKCPLKENPPPFTRPAFAVSVREASFSPWETLKTKDCAGRILADDTVSCPPAVPIAVRGEILDEETVKCFIYYGIETCKVLKKKENET